jgi:DNA invertase Pin-like site-specific DNA recombinase
MEFNSLDAQREACESYIASQKHECLIGVSDSYDDGGFTGGNMERPALKRLINDIKRKQIDTIVVYKVDRLYQALSDFAKLIDLFDEHNVSFVSPRSNLTQSHLWHIDGAFDP